MDDHLGYGRHDPSGRNSGNSRNGHRAKTVLTEAGAAGISVPRDRDSSFQPKIVARRQRRLTGAGDMVISLSAKGLTHGKSPRTWKKYTAPRFPGRPSPPLRTG
jgi:transposase-like protein